MNSRRPCRTALTLARAALFVSALANMPVALAVPSFARQTGLPCSSCHVRFPELNAFGRQFKLNGYTMTDDTKQIEATDSAQHETLAILDMPPLSVMFETAYTATSKSVPDQQNDDAQFPEQMSLFLAGKISPRIGSFIQVTYTQDDNNFSIDNADIRYADNATFAGIPINYGYTLNNAPTVEDLWNSTPVWGFPWAAPDVAPTPIAAPLIDGGLAQDVAGAGGYAMFDGRLYVAATLYRSAHLGSGAPTAGSENTIENVAPYWRVAWQTQWSSNYLEVGAYGLHAKLVPNGLDGPTNDYTDAAADFQFEHVAGGDTLTVHGTYIHESQHLGASVASSAASDKSNNLDTLRLDGGYHVGRWMPTLGVFETTGSRDALLYAPAPVDGSANGKPDSRGAIAQLAYFPWLNTQFTLQYTYYDRFNGRHDDYDGAGRNANDNNTLFLVAWFAW